MIKKRIFASLISLIATYASAQNALDFSQLQTGVKQFADAFPNCPTSTSGQSTIVTSPSAGSNCHLQPNVQTIRVYKIALCTSKPAAPSYSAAAGLASANCNTLFVNDSGSSTNIVLGAVVELKGGTFTKPPTGTYPYLYLEIDPSVGIQSSVQFDKIMADSNGLSTGIYCWSLNTTTYNYALNNMGSMPQATSCGSNAPISSAISTTTVIYNSLLDASAFGGSGYNNVLLNLPTSVGGLKTLDTFLIGSTGTLAGIETVNTISNVKRVSGIVTLPNGGVTITNSTNSIYLGYNNTKGAQVATQNGTTPTRVSKFGNGPFDVSITAETMGWSDVSTTSVQATSNQGYFADNASAPVVVTLPANPNVGDIVEITGIGSGGWSVSQNDKQFINSTNQKNISFVSSNSSWTQCPTLPSASWGSVASSSDGKKLVASALGFSSGVFTSSDSGATWAFHSVPNSGGVGQLASSADGTKLALASSDTNAIYTSSDSGVTWTKTSAKLARYSSIASSSDGSKLFAATYYGGNEVLATSSDGGATWTYVADNKWQNFATSTASSADGSVLSYSYGYTDTSTGNTNSYIAYSINNGVLFKIFHPGASYSGPSPSLPKGIFHIALSSDGSKLVAILSGTGIYISGDSGQTWTKTSAQA